MLGLINCIHRNHCWRIVEVAGFEVYPFTGFSIKKTRPSCPFKKFLDNNNKPRNTLVSHHFTPYAVKYRLLRVLMALFFFVKKVDGAVVYGKIWVFERTYRPHERYHRDWWKLTYKYRVNIEDLVIVYAKFAEIFKDSCSFTRISG